MRIRRTHGIFGGLLVALLGIWGGIIPFVGPYFNYAYTPDKAWTYTSGRLWLEILPGAGALLGGLLMMAARSRASVLFGSLLAIASGAWFALGTMAGPGGGAGGGPGASMPVIHAARGNAAGQIMGAITAQVTSSACAVTPANVPQTRVSTLVRK